MLTSVNFPLDSFSVENIGGYSSLRQKLASIGCDGIEGIWSGAEIPEDFPAELLTGYHCTFFPEWLDLYRGDMDRVYAHFGNDENLKTAFCFGNPTLQDITDFSVSGARIIREAYRLDLERALRLNPAYVVFHVSDVSMEENFTYRWLHTDEEVIDTSIGIINELLKNIEPTFDFLVENQWWPGFRFNDPSLTERLLDGIRYPRKGILLDTGHLMNNNRNIRNQAEGIAYIQEMVRKHGVLSEYIKGMHFHQSVSRRYTRKNVGRLPDDFPPVSDYYRQLSATYTHILQIDRHMPWTNPGCVKLLDLIRPEYLTHEMSGGGDLRFSRAKRQITTIRASSPAQKFRSYPER